MNTSSSFAPKKVVDILDEASKINDIFVRHTKLMRYVYYLEGELERLDAIKHEIPCCLVLIREAVETLTNEANAYKDTQKFFVSEKSRDSNKNSKASVSVGDLNKKRDWLQSTKLCLNSTETRGLSEVSSGFLLKLAAGSNNRAGISIPCRNQDQINQLAGGINIFPSTSGTKKPPLHQRKPRLTWSPELHQRFLDAVEQIGGVHEATPKKIKEMMRTDALTSDEIKSHLQKYRLCIREGQSSNPEGLIDLNVGGSSKGGGGSSGGDPDDENNS